MEIKEMLELRKQTELEILQAVQSSIENFTDLSGVQICNVSIDLSETTSIGSPAREYRATNAVCELDI